MQILERESRKKKLPYIKAYRFKDIFNEAWLYSVNWSSSMYLCVKFKNIFEEAKLADLDDEFIFHRCVINKANGFFISVKLGNKFMGNTNLLYKARNDR